MNLLLAALLLLSPVERELRGGESHVYAIELKAGEFAPQWVQQFVLRRDFDGLAFIESTTASRPRGE